VLIPTLPEKYSINMLRRLNSILDPQIQKHSDKVEKIIHDAGRSMSTGQKRNELIARAEGEYIVQCDCDDIVSTDYIELLLGAIEQRPDVVTFCGVITEDWGPRKKFVIKLGEGYELRDGIYYRYPNHICCFRKDVIKNVKFPHIWVQEDYKWATQVKRMGILKSEVHITKEIYLYEYVSKKPKHA
jgi:glycosyltransferase involved in cell wall biosynthesis